MARPRISLCMIVRDEALFLPGCLASVADAVDEIVVVDTGSVDETTRLAEEAGAKVVHHAWTDDFSAARNAALPHATGDYVLVLDADERLAPGGAEKVRAAVADRTLMLGLLPLHNADRIDASPEEILSGRARMGLPVHVPRLVRRTPDLMWEGIVHEGFRSWLDRNVRASNLVQIDAALLHYGAVPEVREAKRKHERNLALLERMAVLEPVLPNTWAHLAAERIRAGDPDGGVEAVERGWEALHRAVGRKGFRPIIAPIASLRAKYAVARGDHALALATVEQARAWGEQHPNYDWYAGQACEASGDLVRAEKEYRRALARHGQPVSAEVYEGVTSWASECGLGMVLLRAGRAAEALGCFERALAERPDRAEAGLGRADALLAAGRPEEALAALEPWLAGDTGDGWTLAGEILCALGDFDTALTFASRGANGRFIEASRLARRNALHSRLSFHHGRPRAGEGPFGTLGALAARVPLRGLATVTASDVDEAVLALLRQGRTTMIDAWMEPRASAAVPGIREWVLAALSRHGLQWTDDDEPDVLVVGGADPACVAEVCDVLQDHDRVQLAWSRPASLQAEWRAVAGPPTDDLDADDVAARVWLLDRIGATQAVGRRIVVAADLHDVEWLADRLPRARFAHVVPVAVRTELLPAVIELRGRSSSLSSRLFELWMDEWLASRAVLLDRLWAFLGEPSNEERRRWGEAGGGDESAGLGVV